MDSLTSYLSLLSSNLPIVNIKIKFFTPPSLRTSPTQISATCLAQLGEPELMQHMAVFASKFQSPQVMHVDVYSGMG